jgi:tRNA uridine 5-carboxymethylaminomethyl modification enzyme
LLQRPGVTYDTAVASADPGAAVSREALRTEAGRELANQVIEQIETSARYAGYVDKQRSDVARASRAGSTLIPTTWTSLRFGVVVRARPSLDRAPAREIGAGILASRNDTAAMSLLPVHVKKHRRSDSVAGAREPSRADS